MTVHVGAGQARLGLVGPQCAQRAGAAQASVGHVVRRGASVLLGPAQLPGLAPGVSPALSWARCPPGGHAARAPPESTACREARFASLGLAGCGQDAVSSQHGALRVCPVAGSTCFDHLLESVSARLFKKIF